MYLIRIGNSNAVDEALIVVPQNNRAQLDAVLEEVAPYLDAFVEELTIEEIIDLPPTARLDSLRPYIG